MSPWKWFLLTGTLPLTWSCCFLKLWYHTFWYQRQCTPNETESTKTALSLDSGRCFFSHDDVIKWNHFPRYWPFVPVPGEFLAQRPVTRSFEFFFDLRLNKRLIKQSWGWGFETLPRPLWRHSNESSDNAVLMHAASFGYAAKETRKGICNWALCLHPGRLNSLASGRWGTTLKSVVF